MMNRRMKSILALAITSMVSATSIPAIAAKNTIESSDVLAQNRTAQGDITQFGGARRLSAEQTEAMRAALLNSQAKNVILFIGDGMGILKLRSRVTMQKVPAAFLKVLMRCQSPGNTLTIH